MPELHWPGSSAPAKCFLPPLYSCLQVDGALKNGTSVSEVLAATLPVLNPETLDSPPKITKLGNVKLQHFAAQLPPACDNTTSPTAKRAKTC